MPPLGLNSLPRAALAAAIAALVAGFLLGYLLSAIRARRRYDQLDVESRELRAKVEAATSTARLIPALSVAPYRITGKEIAGIIAAVAALATALGTTYVNSQSVVVQDLRSRMADSTRELASLRESAKKVLVYEAGYWNRLRNGVRTDLREGMRGTILDDKFVSSSCKKGSSNFVYNATGAAILSCREPGTVTLQVRSSTRLLLAPEQ